MAEKKLYDIIIIGAGTAGLSAALYGARAGKSVLVLEEKVNGGQIVNSPEVENYPGIRRISGFQFIQELQQQAEECGAVIVNRQVEKLVDQGGRKVVMTCDGLYEGRSAILCTGVVQRKLGLEREKELTGSGVSYCAVCPQEYRKSRNALPE